MLSSWIGHLSAIGSMFLAVFFFAIGFSVIDGFTPYDWVDLFLALVFFFCGSYCVFAFEE